MRLKKNRILPAFSYLCGRFAAHFSFIAMLFYEM